MIQIPYKHSHRRVTRGIQFRHLDFVMKELTRRVKYFFFLFSKESVQDFFEYFTPSNQRTTGLKRCAKIWTRQLIGQCGIDK